MVGYEPLLGLPVGPGNAVARMQRERDRVALRRLGVCRSRMHVVLHLGGEVERLLVPGEVCDSREVLARELPPAATRSHLVLAEERHGVRGVPVGKVAVDLRRPLRLVRLSHILGFVVRGETDVVVARPARLSLDRRADRRQRALLAPWNGVEHLGHERPALRLLGGAEARRDRVVLALSGRVLHGRVRPAVHLVRPDPRSVEVAYSGDWQRDVLPSGDVALRVAHFHGMPNVARGLAVELNARHPVCVPAFAHLAAVLLEPAVLHEVAEELWVHNADGEPAGEDCAGHVELDGNGAFRGGLLHRTEVERRERRLARLERELERLGLRRAELRLDSPGERPCERIDHGRLHAGVSARHEAHGRDLHKRALRRHGKRARRSKRRKVEVLEYDRHRLGGDYHIAARGGRRGLVAAVVGHLDGRHGADWYRSLDVSLLGLAHHEGEPLSVLLLEEVDYRAWLEARGADGPDVAELRGEHGERRGDRARRVPVEEVRPVSGRIGLAAEVHHGLGSCDELARPLAHHEHGLRHGVEQRLPRIHAPHRVPARRLVVPHAPPASGGEVAPGLQHGVVRPVVDRKHVQVLRDPGAQHIQPEVARPEPAGHLDLKPRVDLLHALGADLAEADVVLDRPGGLVALHDLVQPLEAPDAPLVVLGQVRGRLAPSVLVERERLEARRVDAGRQGPLGRAGKEDERTYAVRVEHVHLAVKPIEAPKPALRLQARPSGEEAAVPEADLRGGLCGILVTDVRAAERRALPAKRLGDVGDRGEEAAASVLADRHLTEHRAAALLRRDSDLSVLHGERSGVDLFALGVDELDVCLGRWCARELDAHHRALVVEVEASGRLRPDAEALRLLLHNNSATTRLPRERLAVASDELRHEADLAVRRGSGLRCPFEVELVLSDGDRLLLQGPEAVYEHMLAPFVHDAVRVVDPRAERSDLELRALAPVVGGVEEVLHLERHFPVLAHYA